MIPENREGASSKIEKEKKHYQGLPEDVGPDSGKNEKRQDRKVTKRKKSEVEKTAY